MYRKVCFLMLTIGILWVPSVVLAGGQREAVEERVTLQWWFGREEFIPGDNFETFHKENPQIRIEPEVVPLGQQHSDFIRNYETGTAPDIAQIFMTYITTLAREGVLLDMTPYFEQWKQQKPELYEQLISVAWEAASSNGTPYGLSAHATAIAHVFRVDWLNSVGITTPPRTWDGVINAAIALRDSGTLSKGQYPYATPGATNIGTQITVNGYFMAMGGRYDDGIPVVDSEAGRYMISFYQRLAGENLINPDALAWKLGGVRGAFVGNNAGMFTMGTNVFPAFQDAGLVYGDQEQWVATEQPRRAGGEKEWRQFGNAFPYVVNSNTDHPEAVLKALQYIVRQEIVGEVANRYQPATNSAVSQDPEWQRTHPWAEDLEDAFINMKTAPTHPRQQQINDTMIQLVQEALTNPDKDPVKMAQTFQKHLDSFR